MCGICGIYSFAGTVYNAQERINSALGTLKNRGPEVQASFTEGNTILGHSRLSIIDISDAANQPFSDETGKYTIVFNGEIYNFKQLRQQLIVSGLSFRTQSDTEVLLKWLILKGPQGIKDLQGFFAFALYHKDSGKLILARDRFGKKPLLYCQTPEAFLFASEMKAMLKLGIPKKIDPVSLNIYFQLNYIPGPWSIYQDVFKLQPGHYMVVDGGKTEIHRYYQLPLSPMEEYNRLSYEKAQQLLFTKMENAVQKRLVADVPLGAFLSGGIDSSVVVALAARHIEKLKTFSIGFKDEPMFDETHYARSVARMHNTEHTEFSLTTTHLLGCLYDVLDYIDEPFADSSALAVYILSRETRNRVTVALSGDGADEMFAGYNKHMAHYKALEGGLLAQGLKYIYPVISLLPKGRNTPLANKIRQLHRFGSGMVMNDSDRYWRWAAFDDEYYSQKLLRLNVTEADYYKRKAFLVSDVMRGGDLNNILRNDMHLVLTNDMLTKVDLMSMANSLEVRVPFLDHDLVNFVFSLPSGFKIDHHQRKKILKDTFRDLLPPELYNRPKQGFEVPLLGWFRKELKGKILNQWLNEDFIREQNLFNPGVINNLKKKLFSPSPSEIHAKIWSLLVFQHWYTKYHNNET